jgi:hypothetical protein
MIDAAAAHIVADVEQRLPCSRCESIASRYVTSDRMTTLAATRNGAIMFR